MSNKLLVSLLYYSELQMRKTIPKIYFRISNKRGIPVSTLRGLEKQGRKLVKLGQDVKYFETCLDISLCPEVLKFKILTLNYDKNGKNLHQAVVRKKLKEVSREKRIAEARFRTQKWNF